MSKVLNCNIFLSLKFVFIFTILYGISSCQSTYIQCTSYQNEKVQSLYAGDFFVGIFKQYLRSTTNVLNSMDPDMAQRVGHVLDPNCCLQNVLLKFE